MKTTVIGLGAMGAGMAGNLFRAGHLTQAWNRSTGRASAAAAQHGFSVADSLESAAAQSDLVITSVSADGDLLEVIDRLAEVMTAGSVVLDTSTVSIETARQVADRLQAHGIHFLDSPVSGGKEGAEKATMVMMVGGDDAVLRAGHADPRERSAARSCTWGRSAAARPPRPSTRSCAPASTRRSPRRWRSASTRASTWTRWSTWSAAAPPATGLSSTAVAACAPAASIRASALALHHKDLKICQAMLAADHVQLPMVEMTLVHYERLMADGHGDEDISALYRLKRPLFAEDSLIAPPAS